MISSKENSLTNLRTVVRSDVPSKTIKARILECLQKDCSDQEIGKAMRLATLDGTKVSS